MALDRAPVALLPVCRRAVEIGDCLSGVEGDVHAIYNGSKPVRYL